MNALNPHQLSTIQCAGPGCSNLRLESSHWFLITIEHGAFSCRPYHPARELRSLDLPACGQACAQKLLERFLSPGSACSTMNGLHSLPVYFAGRASR